ncbi:MAG: DUF2267 domain-containing protein [Chloroflexota bacterium]
MMPQPNGQALASFYEQVGRASQLPTPQHAQRWAEGVLKTLGLHLDGRTRKALAQALPEELAAALKGVFWLVNLRDPHLSGREFCQQVARRSGHSDSNFARLPTLAVFGTVKKMIGADLQQRVGQALPPEVSQLWQEA